MKGIHAWGLGSKNGAVRTAQSVEADIQVKLISLEF